MSRMLKPAAAGLAISSLCLSFAAEVPAQNAAKKKPAVKQAQAVEDPPAGAGTKAKGQGSPATTKSGQLPRPEVKPMVVEKPDPALEQVLKDWELNTARFKKITGRFRVFKYDPTFQVEKRAEGKFAHEAPDKGSYERLGVEIAKGQPAGKKNFALQSDTPERWVCTGKEIIKIDDKEKTYERFPIPPASQGENIIEGPLPFLFGMKAERAKARYKLTLVKKSETEIWLQAIPRKSADSENWVKAVVIIDAEKYIPTAVKTFDPTGAETVHLFDKDSIAINPKQPGWFGWGKEDPFAPKLRGYKQIQSGDKGSPGERLAPPTNPKQASSPINKSRSAIDDFDRSADVSEAPAQRKKTATATRRD